MKLRTRLGIGIACILTAVLISVGSTVYISHTTRRLLRMLDEAVQTEEILSFWEKCSPVLGMMVSQSDVNETDAALRELPDLSSEEKTEAVSEITVLLRKMGKNGEPTLGFFF